MRLNKHNDQEEEEGQYEFVFNGIRAAVNEAKLISPIKNREFEQFFSVFVSLPKSTQIDIANTGVFFSLVNGLNIGSGSMFIGNDLHRKTFLDGLFLWMKGFPGAYEVIEALSKKD